ncbi:MAG: hypothetical protein ACP5LX_00385 [Nitrososphaeria archaeon]|jgi:Na+/alanine symporter
MGNNHRNETKNILEKIIDNSCLTELEFLALINKKTKNPSYELFNKYKKLNKFYKKSSGEKSTIKRRAGRNIKACLLTLILFLTLGIINEKNLLQLKEISDMLKDVLDIENEEIYLKLDALLDTIVKELF